MGLGSILKSLGKFGLNFVPGGGAINSILDMAGAVAPVLGGAAKGRSEGRAQEIQDQLGRDRLNLDAARTNLDATRVNQEGTRSAFDMAQRAREFGLTAPRYRMGTTARGSLAGAAPVKINWGGPGSGLRGQQTQVTGGFMERDPRMKQMADSVMDRELRAQLSGADNITAPEMPTAVGVPTSFATPAPKSGFGDKALGWGSGITSILGALGKFKKPPTGNQPNVSGVMNPDLIRNVRF